MLYRVHLAWAGFELTTLVVIGTDWISSYKSNYHMITTNDGPQLFFDPTIIQVHNCRVEIEISENNYFLI
jgi:hypothetical protein